MEHQRAIQNLAVERYVLGEMSPREQTAFEEHFFECSLCGEDVRVAATFMEDAREILGEDAQEDRQRISRPLQGSSRTARAPGGGQSPGWLAWLKPQFAAPALAALLLLVGLQSLRTIPNLQRDVEKAVAPRIMASVALRPAVRGVSSTLVVPQGAAVLLTLDLPDAPERETPLQFVIESAAGKEVLRVPGLAPEPGRPVNLMIPRLDIPAGPYTVVAEQASTPGARGRELARFPFQLELQ